MVNCTLLEPAAIGMIASLRCIPDAEPIWRTIVAIATPLLVFCSALIAWRSLRNTRAVARQKATLDLIEKVESTPHYRELNVAFTRIRRAGGFAALHDPQTEAVRRDRQAVLDYLNHYELVAIGIRHDILDDTIYRSWMQSHVVMEWNAARDFIQAERWRLNDVGDDMVYRPQLFASFQAAVCRWSPSARPLNMSSSPKPPVPQGVIAPGDVALPSAQPADDENPQ